MADAGNTYKVKVNGFEFHFTKAEIDAVDFIKVSDLEFNLIRNHRSFNAKIIASNAGKKLKLESGGKSFDIEIRDTLDQQLEKMGLGAVSAKQLKEIRAPMPGLVLEIAVTEGQDVVDGDKLLILEAMKMENSIVIHSPAKIKKIAVIPGQAVEKGQVLIELE